MSQIIVKSKMRFAKKSTPEERRLGKFAYLASDESSELQEVEPGIDLTEHGGPSADGSEAGGIHQKRFGQSTQEARE